MLKDLRVAGSFLTRVPLHLEGTVDVQRATPWFPVVGLVIGAMGAAVFVAALEILPPGPAAALALVTTAAITGAFHHDGLADIADAFGGGWDRDQRLAILKDSRHGTYGVVSLVLDILVQWSALATLSARWGAAALVAAHVLGRTAILGVLLAGRPASRTGMGTDYAAGLPRRAALAGLIAGLAITTVLLGPWVLVAAGIVTAGAAVVHELARRKIGGFSGDVLGAVEQVGEALVLLVVAALATAGHLPWWSAL